MDRESRKIAKLEDIVDFSRGKSVLEVESNSGSNNKDKKCI